jgi:NADH-quinone oxidoreductase subunit J
VSAIVFLALALLVVAAAVTVVVHPSPVHGACALVATLFLLAVLFVGLDAELVAVLQVIVYAGAIVVLFLFVIMLLNLQVEVRAMGGAALVAAAVAGGLGLAVAVAAALRRTAVAPAPDVPAGYGGTLGLAERLFTVHLLSFELTGLLLLVAIVGAVALGRRGA